ncbi:thiol:disulfide interchange protein [Zymomonas mobilis]|uniref:protein-disulfide reductase DsbD family protein n=1 Tax=Zymomonas mobilis TaxID=542 RepID=UPI00026D8127|nr:thioredoxin family protein [Zymomonas mobilis]AFN57547.1 cytochrome c biogenesis protein transmembrane region [Zymomonas mobilis subsp. mobilis ATCC 29191]TQK78686.1 thiol:disulfide interchange protein [Zymomonas mobilis]TQL16110.1 thiol:disulfide interchange protein [Zymomonas mobilis]
MTILASVYRAFGCLFCWALALFIYPLSAATLSDSDLHIEPQFIAETLTPKAGTKVTVALEMKPHQGWHGYWKNGGDAGQETEIIWHFPYKIKASAIQYPIPEKMKVAGLMSYVYQHDYRLLIDLDIPAGLPVGTALPISAQLNWLACTDTSCVLETAERHLLLHIGKGEITADNSQLFQAFRQALPEITGRQALFAQQQNQIILKLDYPETEKIDSTTNGVWFFPSQDGVFDYSADQRLLSEGNALFLTLPLREKASIPSAITGVLRLQDGKGFWVNAQKGNISLPDKSSVILTASSEEGQAKATASPQQNTAQNETPSVGKGHNGKLLWWALAGAFLGGLILNIMPCVFPILSLKALSLARTHAPEKAHRLEASAYSAGVIMVCLGLGAALLLFRAGGHAVGWAFQLQYPHIVLALMVLTAMIGFNLAGLFDLPSFNSGANPKQDSLLGAFTTGALAAFIATPCTGPFMAAAIGVALILSPIESLMVFAGLGIGMALPFLAIGFVPPIRKLLPRPGAWMATMRHILAIPMFITALWLGWTLGHQIGTDGLIVAFGICLISATGLWWTGKRQHKGKNHSFLPAAIAILFSVVIGSFTPAHPIASETNPKVENAKDAPEIEPFSEQAVEELHRQKKPLFIYFSADWCLTCKVNEKMAIDRDSTRQAFRQKGIVTLHGDWTNGDPEITRFLSKMHRSGIPLYLYYPVNGEIQILPQILTTGLLQNLGK